MADIHIYVVDKADIGHNGPTYVSESGPGNLNFSSVTGSPHASPKVGNESVKVDDINTSLKNGHGNSVVNEVEGSEQDEGEGGAEAAEQGGAEAAEQGGAEQASAEGAQHNTLEAQEAPQEEAAQQEAAQQEAAPQQQAAPQQEAAPQQQEAQEQSAERAASDGKNGHDGKSEIAQWVKNSNVGHNGPTLVGESGPGNLNFSSVTGSPYASPKVGNESVKVDDINTSLKGGKGNSVVNEVEGSEQDEIADGAAAQQGAE
ncbi:hypothetical protein [Spirillospora sp. NPDC048824]|uniref:hypothetical protein n=1 Tax=Spirillospora sp. NPDC048824 TaxID=3364526 RepID=UPI0037171A12